ncbi:MAG: TIM barrel protein, partial [Spirochaetota bacterium]
HLKDVRAEVLEEVKQKKMSFLNSVRAGVFTIPGDGMIDFPAIFTLLEQHNYSGWMVVETEQDPAKANPFVYAKKAREYIQNETGL